MARVVKKYKNGGKEPTTPEEILAYAQEKRKLEAELLEKYGSVRKIPEGIMRNKKVFAFTDVPPLPKNTQASDAEIQYAMDYYGVPEAKAKYNLAYPQFAPGGDQDPSTWAFRVESREPFVRTVATTLSFAPVLGEVLDIINVPWAAATGTDMYTGREMSTSEASAWAAGGILIPNVLQKPTQWLVKQGAKNADDIKRIIQPHLKNIDNAPEDLKPLLELQKKSSDLKAHLRQYDVPQGTDMGKGFKSSYDPGRTTSDAAADFLTQTNPNLVLQFSPSSFNKGMFDEDLVKWGDAYLTSYRGVGAKNIDEAATFMRNPHGGGLQQYGKGTYSTSDLPTASGYGSYVGAIRDMPSIGRSGQFGGDIIKDISALEARGGSTKLIYGDNPQILRPDKGIYTSGDIVRVSRPETTIKSGILDVVPSSQGDDLLKYRSDFGGVGPFGKGGYGHPDTKRGMDEIYRLINEGKLNPQTIKEKGGKINSYEKGGILQSMAKKNRSDKNKFVSKKVRILRREGKGLRQAVAIALDMYEKKKQEKKFQEGGLFEKLKDRREKIKTAKEYYKEEGENPTMYLNEEGKIIMPGVGYDTGEPVYYEEELTPRQYKRFNRAQFRDYKRDLRKADREDRQQERQERRDERIKERGYRRVGRADILPFDTEDILDYLAGDSPAGYAVFPGMGNRLTGGKRYRDKLGNVTLDQFSDNTGSLSSVEKGADDSVLDHELVHKSQYGPLQLLASYFGLPGAGRIQDKTTRKAFKNLMKSIRKNDTVLDEKGTFQGDYMAGDKSSDVEFDAILKSGLSSASLAGYDLEGKSFDEIVSILAKAEEDKNISTNMGHLSRFMTGTNWNDEQKGFIMDAIKANLGREAFTAEDAKQDLR